MIIKGGSRAGATDLSRHLERTDNDRVRVIEIRGVVAENLTGALREMEAHAEATRCKKALYHSQINPEPGEVMTLKQWQAAVDRLEKNLGLEGQPRAVVLHEKHGRRHAHVVWSRIDTERGRAISDSHNYRTHERTARELEQAFKHRETVGPQLTRERQLERPARERPRAEIQQTERTGIDARDVGAEVAELYRKSNSGRALEAALKGRGYEIARGDRRGVVIIDRAGGVHSLSRRAGVRAADLAERFPDLDPAQLRSVDQVKAERSKPAIEKPARERQPEQRREKLWDAYQREKQAGREQRQQQQAAQREAAKVRFKEIAERTRAERQRIKQKHRAGSDARTVALSVEAFRAIEERDRLKEQLDAQRRAARPATWRGWLDQRAAGGDEAAQRYVASLDRRAEREAVPQAAQQPARGPAPERLPQSVTRGVTYDRSRDGRAVEYKIRGRAAVEDRGNLIVVKQGRDPQAIALALSLHLQQRGPKLTVSGSSDFKRKTAEVAADRGMRVDFADPRIAKIYEQRRREIVAERQANRPGQARGLDTRLPGLPTPTPTIKLTGPTPAQAAQREAERQNQQQQEKSR